MPPIISIQPAGKRRLFAVADNPFCANNRSRSMATQTAASEPTIRPFINQGGACVAPSLPYSLGQPFRIL